MGGRGSGGSNRRPAAEKKMEGRRNIIDDLPDVVTEQHTEDYLNLQPPSHYDDDQKRLWEKLYISIPSRYWGIASHEGLLEMCADAWSDYRKAHAALMDEGMIVTDDHGNRRRNPFSLIARAALSDFTKLCNALGLGSQARTELIKHGSEEINWIEELERAERLEDRRGRSH